MAQFRRWFVGMCSGRVNCTFQWAAINRDSVVLVSASEGDQDVRVLSSRREPDRFSGAALITVHNIAPFGEPHGEDPNNGVRFVITVDWDDDLPIWADIALMDDVAGWITSR